VFISQRCLQTIFTCQWMLDIYLNPESLFGHQNKIKILHFDYLKIICTKHFSLPHAV